MAWALDFTGNDNTLKRRVGPFPLPTNFTQDMRIDVTIRYAAASGFRCILNTPEVNASNTNFFVGTNNNGQFYFWSNGSQLNSGVVPVDGQLFTISVTVSTGRVVGLSVNGSVPVTTTIAGLSAALYGSLLVGGTTNLDGSGFRDAFAGQLRRVETWVGGVKTGDYVGQSGTGTTFNNLLNAAVATQAGTWPTNDAEWVFYNSITALPIPSNTLGAALNQPCAINLNNYFTGATSYSVVSGSLPAGLSISGNQIVGTPTAAQSTTLVIRAANSIDELNSVQITFNTGLWFLNNASSSSAIISIPTVTIGATVGDFFEMRAVANAGNPAVSGGNTNYILCGMAGENYTNFIHWDTIPAQIGLRFGNSTAVQIPSPIPPVGTIFTLRFTKVSATQWQASRDGSNLGAPFTANNFTLNTLFCSVVGNAAVFRGGIYHVDISTNGGASPTRYYDGSASGGVGNLLIDRVSGQNGTQAGTWPADNSEWVSYAPPPQTSNPTQIKLFDGTAFSNRTIKRWNGSAFVDVTLKRWNGSAFVDL